MSPRRLSFLAPALCAALAGSAQAAVPHGPTGLRFYSPPAAKVAGRHGTLVWARRFHAALAPRGGKSWLVVYRSMSPKGKTVPVSGIITVPTGTAPTGGWPVVSWAHGTTGIADVCAPSRIIAGAADGPGYGSQLAAEQSHWVREGFAVAQTDYAGLGTAGRHPYLIGRSEGRSVIDIVSAARALNAHVGKHWVAIGRSQGGHATLWAAALAPTYAPGLKLEGALPLAPASHTGEQAEASANLDGNPLGGLPGLIVAAALDAAQIKPADSLSDKALALYPQIDQVCLDKLSAQDSWAGLALKDMFRDGFDKTPLVNTLSANDPEDLTIRVPLLVAQGTSDTTVLPSYTGQTVSDLQGRGTKITYDKYDGVNHTGVVEASRTDADTFIDTLLEKAR
jgi:pimeloyl-ACP methyl ester carboxylesterase